MNKDNTSSNHFNETENEIYGVIGICGIVGNIAARVLMDRGCHVLGTDMKSEDECEFKYALKKYIQNQDLEVYFSEHPDSFFSRSKYIIPPPSLSKDSKVFRKMEKIEANILDVDTLLNEIKPDKPVLCVTGTNGKTTTTTLLKHICKTAGLTTTEHGFRNLQGNIDYIPPLQARLKGDVAVLETGTFGIPGDLKRMVERCQPSCGIVTNITPDHIHDDQDFLSYASIKGTFIEYFKKGKLIVNADDPTLWGLVESYRSTSNNQNVSSDVNGCEYISFGVDYEATKPGKKKCICGREIQIKETISGVGYYNCKCGLKRPEPDYLAGDVGEDSFTLKTPEGDVQFKMKIKGLHNVYNATGSIVAAIEFFKIDLNTIKKAVESFEGVSGRMEYMYTYNGSEVIVDYGHNPAGVGTVLREMKKIYKKLAVVVTISSESGESGDLEILQKAVEIGDFIVPASFYSRQAAEKHISSPKIILTDESKAEFKAGTLGATSKQVLEGLKKGLECDVDAVICLGEAAFKYKEHIKSLPCHLKEKNI